MADKWTTVHPIPWRETSFTWLPYWIYDIIVKAYEDGEDWRDYAEDKYKKEFDTLKQAFTDYTDVDCMESRNGYIYSLLSLTKVTISSTGDTTLQIGDPDLVVSSLFDIEPIKRSFDAVLTVDNAHCTIVNNAVHAVSAGVSVVTATIGDVSETVTVTVTA